LGTVLSLLSHTQKGSVAVVDAMAKDPASPVKGVVAKDTVAGRNMADAMPGDTTMPAGTLGATQIAAK